MPMMTPSGPTTSSRVNTRELLQSHAVASAGTMSDKMTSWHRKSNSVHQAHRPVPNREKMEHIRGKSQSQMHKARIMNLQHAIGRRDHNMSQLAGGMHPSVHIEALPRESFFSRRDSKSQSQKRRHLLNRSQQLFKAAVAGGRTSPGTTQKSSLARVSINGHEYSQPLFTSTSKHKMNNWQYKNKDIEDLGILQARKSTEKRVFREVRQSMDIMNIN